MNRILLFVCALFLIIPFAGLMAQMPDCDPPEIICPTTPFELTMCGPGEICVDLPIVQSNYPVSMTVLGASVDKRGSVFCYPVEESGSYTFTIIAQNECGADTCEITANVTINEPPVIECPPETFETMICEPQQICIDLPITDAESVMTSGGFWEADQFCFFADTTGTYEYTITASNGCGSDECTISYYVEAVPPVYIDCPMIELAETICGAGEVCVDLPVMYADSVTVMGAEWAEDMLCFQADTSGFYAFRVTAYNYCGELSCDLAVNVTVEEAPVISCPFEPIDYTLCEGSQVAIALPISNPGNVQVSEGGSWANDTLTFIPEMAGTYDFTITAENECGADTCMVEINVTFGMVPMISCPEEQLEYMICEAGTICVPLPIENPGAVTVNNNGSWEADELCFFAVFDDTPSYDVYTFQVIAESECGADTCDLSVGVTTMYAPMILCPEDDTIQTSACAGSLVDLPIDILYYDSLIVEGGEYVEGNVEFVADTSQVRYVNIIAINDCGRDSCDFFVDLTVMEGPDPQFGIDSSSQGETPVIVYFRNETATTPDMTFLWDFGDGSTSDEFEPSHAYDSNGFYDVSLTATNQCGDSTLTKIDFVKITEAQVVIPTNEWISIYCAEPMLDDEPLMPGDIISCYDPQGVLCGMGMVKENGSYGFLPIYRDDPYSTQDEGAEPGDVITIEINFERVYALPPIIWSENGARIEACDFTTQKCTEVSIGMGWSLISWNNTYEADIEDFVGDVIPPECVQVILSFDQGGLTYNPELPQYSTLDHVDYYHGYWIRGLCETFAPIQICSGQIDPSEVIPEYTGWNLVSYWPDDCLPIEDGFESIIDILLVALGYNNMGLTWQPDLNGFNTLEELCPGFGYWTKVSEDAYLAYPGFGIMPPPTGPFARSLENGIVPSRTWINLYGENLRVDDQAVEAGSEIRVFSQNGTLCGSAVYDGNLLKFVPVYGYDGANSVTQTYPEENENLVITINGDQVYPEVKWTQLGDCIDISNLYTKPGGSNPAVPDKYSLDQNYPNPFNPNTVISFSIPEAGNVELAVYNMLGQKVATLVNEYYSAGRYQAEWNGDDDNGNRVSSGVYLYRLKAGDYVETKKMILTK